MSTSAIFPEPWEIVWGDGDIELGAQRSVTVAADSSDNEVVGAALERLDRAMAELGAELVEVGSAAEADVTLKLDAAAVAFADRNRDQAYVLRVDHGGVSISAAEPAGLLYGAVTLAHLLRAGGGGPACPRVVVRDRPDLARRGLFCESRWGPDQMTLDDWKAAVDNLVDLKFNMLTIGIYNCWPIQYYGQVSEFFFVPTPSHPELKAPARIDYYSPGDDEYKRLDYLPRIFEENLLGEICAYARARAMTVRPHFNGPGHNSLIPRLIPEVSARDEEGKPTGYGYCLSSDRTYEVLFDIIDDIAKKHLLPNGVRSWHMAADEVYPLVGMHPDRPFERISPWCQCEQCKQKTEAELYVEYVLRLAGHLKEIGITEISMWNDQLVRGGSLNEELLEKMEAAGLKDNIILHWWRYSEFFDDIHPEFGLRRWVTPMTGYYYQCPYRGHLENIFLAAQKGYEQGAEGIESYGVYDPAFHRNFCAMSEWGWNFLGGGELEDFHKKYARALFADKAWQEGLAAMRVFGTVVDSPAGGSIGMGMVRYGYDYGQSEEQATARENYPQAQIRALCGCGPYGRHTTGAIAAVGGAMSRAASMLEQLEWCDDAKKDIYLIECARYSALATAFTVANDVVASYERMQDRLARGDREGVPEALANSAERVKAALEAMDQVMARIEQQREHYLVPHMLRELTGMRRFLAELHAVLREQAEAGEVTELPDLAMMKIAPLPWVG
jgi:hypothetical protein